MPKRKVSFINHKQVKNIEEIEVNVETLDKDAEVFKALKELPQVKKEEKKVNIPLERSFLEEIFGSMKVIRH